MGCERIGGEACVQADKNGVCERCEPGYFVENGKCVECLNVTNACDYCAPVTVKVNDSAVNPKYKGKISCESCGPGYVKDNNTGGCIKTIENCATANDDEPNGCDQCIEGYSYDRIQKKCRKNEMFVHDKCEVFGDYDTCIICRPGFIPINEGKKCEKCPSSCATCVGQNANQCLSCSLAKLVVPEKITTFDIWGERRSTCIDDCNKASQTEVYEKDPFSNYCLLNKEKHKKPKEKYPFERNTEMKDKCLALVYDANVAEMSYQYYTNFDIIENEKRQNKTKTTYDKHCSYNGNWMERLSQEKETMYECKCVDGSFGANCEASEGLYDALNSYCQKILKEVKFPYKFEDPIQPEMQRLQED
jgi:hypothetical protein